MAGRIRTIKPEWLEDEKLLACSERARLLSVALILMADDYGNGRANPLFVRAQAGLYLATVDEIGTAMSELESAHFIIRYENEEQRYYSIRNWGKHQRVDKPGKPRVPGPGDGQTTLVKGALKSAYFIRGKVTGLIKIGESIDPISRLADLAACGSEELELLAIGGVESDLHAEFSGFRVHGEWFEPCQEILARIRELSPRYPVPLACAGYESGKRTLDNVPGNIDNITGNPGNIPGIPGTDLRPPTTTTIPMGGTEVSGREERDPTGDLSLGFSEPDRTPDQDAGHQLPPDASPGLLAIVEAMQRVEFDVPGRGPETIWKNAKRPAQLAANLEKSCPAVDVPALIGKLAGWTVANPGRAKRDLGKFLWNAATREQDNPRPAGQFQQQWRGGHNEVEQPPRKIVDLTEVVAKMADRLGRE
jgi:hypothetical protein